MWGGPQGSGGKTTPWSREGRVQGDVPSCARCGCSQPAQPLGALVSCLCCCQISVPRAHTCRSPWRLSPGCGAWECVRSQGGGSGLAAGAGGRVSLQVLWEPPSGHLPETEPPRGFLAAPPPPRFRSLSPGGTPLRSHFHTNSHLRACFWEAAEKSCLPAKWGGRGAEKSRPPEDTGSRDHPGAPTPQHGCQGNPTRPERQKGPLLEVSGGWRWWKARRLEVLAAGSEP